VRQRREQGLVQKYRRTRILLLEATVELPKARALGGKKPIQARTFWLTAGGLLAMSVIGFLLFMGGTMRYYHNPAFRLKMLLFVIALVFHFALQIRVARQAPERSQNSRWLKLGSIVSLLLWFTIGLAGRATGYV
jgi:uncharacterized membrane protein